MMEIQKNNIIKKEIASGQKYQTIQGTYAIKDGIRDKNLHLIRLKKPSWLKVSAKNVSTKYFKVKSITEQYHLTTVCQEAKCPNMNECWSYGTATIMLMGSVCTRACKFCSVDTGNPRGFLNQNEPKNVAKSVQLMNLGYVVLTSVNRDDLQDGGAGHYAKVINEIKKIPKNIRVEALTPDFQGKIADVNKLLETDLDVFAQNIETVERLTNQVRDSRASYWQTIQLLKYVKQIKGRVLTKTSIMLGLGETKEEVITTMEHLRIANVDILTLGQYMQPTRYHLPIVRFVPPSEFREYRAIGLKKGFLEVTSGPMVRSSYRADRVFQNKHL